MVKKVDARRFLSNVPDDKVFWMCNGTILRNLGELEQCLEQMNEGAYKYHANKEKNDFGSWVKEVIGDKHLSDSLSKTRNKVSANKKVKERIKTLRKAAG